MTTNTIKKAPGDCDSEGLMTNTNNSYSLTGGGIQQAPDAKDIATQIARLALAGHVVHKGSEGDFTVCKYGLTRYCENFAELVAFARKLGVKNG